jgi:hypothetical protein
MRDNVEAEGPKDYIRKAPVFDYALNEMKTRFTDLHARTAFITILLFPIATMCRST